MKEKQKNCFIFFYMALFSCNFFNVPVCLNILFCQVSAQGHHEAKAPIRSLKFSVSNEGYRWKDYSEKNIEVKQR